MSTPTTRLIDFTDLLPTLVQLARVAEGNTAVLDAVIRLAFAYGVATAPTEDEVQRELTIRAIEQTFDKGLAAHEDRFREITR